jgi:hypothetical protein
MGNNPVILIDPNGGETKHRNGLAGGSCGARDIKLAFSSLDGNISKVINTDLPQGNAIYGGSNKNIWLSSKINMCYLSKKENI